MNDITLVAAVTLAGLLAAGLMFWPFTRSRELLERWADDNSFQIVESSYRVFRRGPFFWTSSKGQTVYRVTVREAKGVARSGWVRCGGWWAGLFSNKVEVRWDEPPP